MPVRRIAKIDCELYVALIIVAKRRARLWLHLSHHVSNARTNDAVNRTRRTHPHHGGQPPTTASPSSPERLHVLEVCLFIFSFMCECDRAAANSTTEMSLIRNEWKLDLERKRQNTHVSHRCLHDWLCSKGCLLALLSPTASSSSRDSERNLCHE